MATAESGTRPEADRARLGEQSALGRHHARLHGRRRAAPARLDRHRAHARRDGRRAALAAPAATSRTSTRSARSPAIRPSSRCAPASRRSTSAAGRSRRMRTSPGQMYPDQSLYPVELGAAGREADQPGAAARRSDRSQRREERHALVRADRRRCRGGLRRLSQRVRADEADDRVRRGRPSTSKTSSPPRRSAATSAGKCSCRRRSSSARSPRRGSRRT